LAVADLRGVVGLGPAPLSSGTGLRTGEEVFARAHELARLRGQQVVSFAGGPVGLVFFADLHFGDPGVDVGRAFEDARLVLETPGLYVGGVVGDLVNNFILGKLLALRLRTGVAIPDEWGLAKAYLELLGPKLLAVVGGNHDAWTTLVAGLDVLCQVVPQGEKHNILYDPHEVAYTVTVDGVTFPGCIRHRWRLRSMYNPTHPIEQAARFGKPFRWAVGAHYHEGAVARSFVVGDDQRLALICGSYKRYDEYARERGFVTQGPGVAAGLLLDPETGSVTGFDNLQVLTKVLRLLW
jgi:hypothetical protein